LRPSIESLPQSARKDAKRRRLAEIGGFTSILSVDEAAAIRVKTNLPNRTGRNQVCTWAHNPTQLGILDASDDFVAHEIFSALLFSAYTSISLSPSTEPL
jgi:hypothetical protein